LKKQSALPATARNSLPQESGTNQNALFNAPFCGDKFFTDKRQEHAFYVYYFYESTPTVSKFAASKSAN
jgi:hypothetical protein